MWVLSKIWMMNFCDAGSEAFKLMMNCAIGMSLQYKHDKSPSVTKLRARVKLSKSLHHEHEIYAHLNAIHLLGHSITSNEWLQIIKLMTITYQPKSEWLEMYSPVNNFLGWKGFKLMRYLPGYEQPFSGINHLVGVWSLESARKVTGIWKLAHFLGLI